MLSPKDNEITGKCGDGDAPAAIAGKVDDKKITWALKTEYTAARSLSNTPDNTDRNTKLKEPSPLRNSTSKAHTANPLK